MLPVNIKSPGVVYNKPETDKEGIDEETLKKINEKAKKVAEDIQSGIDTATNIKDAAGKAMSGALSGISTFTGNQMQKQQEQEELSRLMQNLQTNFTDQTSDGLGQNKNIWE